MRKVVVVEGKLLPHGMMLAKGALKDPGKPVPVTMGYDHSTIVGKAVDFERNEETGEISFDIQFAPGYAGGEDLIKDAELSLSAYGLEISDDILIESAKIGAAVLDPFGAIPKAVPAEPIFKWSAVVEEWEEHWRNRKDDDLVGHFHAFWNDHRREHLRQHYLRGELACECNEGMLKELKDRWGSKDWNGLTDE